MESTRVSSARRRRIQRLRRLADRTGHLQRDGVCPLPRAVAERVIGMSMPSESVSTKPAVGPEMSLTEYVRTLIGERDEHLQAATAIDAELKALHAMLAEDVPGRGPDRVMTPRPSAFASAPPQTDSAPDPASAQAKRRYIHRPNEDESDALILAAVDSGIHRPREIEKACAPVSWEAIRHALYSLVDRGVLTRTGQTQNTRYTRYTRPAAAPAPKAHTNTSAVAAVQTKASVLAGLSDVAASSGGHSREPEYEVAWRPGRDAKSLIGDRVTKSSVFDAAGL